MELAEVLQLKYPEIDLLNDVIIMDQGKGSFIFAWNLSDIPQPTQEEVDKWKTELDLQYRQQQAVRARVYPPISDQLDMIYKDNLNGTTVWKDTITAIKMSHPKPTE